MLSSAVQRWAPSGRSSLVFTLLLALLVVACTRSGFDARADARGVGDDGRAAGDGVDGQTDAAAITLRGNISEQSAPPSVLVGAWESDSEMRLFAEQRRVKLTEQLAVNLIEPGIYSDMGRLSPGNIPAGSLVASYLVHFDPVGRGNKALAAASIAFTRPILGLIARNPALTASDALLGAEGTAYPSTARAVDSPEDALELSEDRYVLRLVLAADYAVDQVRVVVAAE